MSEFLRTALVLFLTVAPLSALGPFQSFTEPGIRLRRALAISSVAFALLAATALIADSFLGWLDISSENFQLAAALILLPHSFRLIIGANTRSAHARTGRRHAWLLPLTVPLLISPASVATTISYASRFGSGTAIAAAALVLALTAAMLAGTARLTATRESLAITLVNRFSGALLIAIAVELAVDGIGSV